MFFDNVQNKVSSIELSYRNENLTHISDFLKEIDHDVQNENFIKNNLIKSGFKSLDKII
ncbi:replicative DNA helicase domain-containing protein [Borreliella bavariensis]|uniref:replicative DNA helicase domain-containing protein n=1 Tax=Borreliella bavariensis TaxID=664662 RepID=UPI001CB74B01|nr:replicative DNA helicase domain-containing protein [Borreliella bavariensis]WLN24790.1 replicative DNA helicase domain-containing protein [Borreliella bavariensis]